MGINLRIQRIEGRCLLFRSRNLLSHDRVALFSNRILFFSNCISFLSLFEEGKLNSLHGRYHGGTALELVDCARHGDGVGGRPGVEMEYSVGKQGV